MKRSVWLGMAFWLGGGFPCFAQGAAGNDVVTGIVVSPQGDSYVVGYSKGTDSGYDFLTLKYDSKGDLQWSRRYDGGGKLDDKPSAVGLDAAGNVYVTGGSSQETTGSDYLTLKYSASGQLQWAKRFNGAGDGFDKATAMSVDPSGNVVVTGFSWGGGKDYDAVTVEYDAKGAQLWAETYAGTSKGDDFGSSVKMDSAGNVYVAGYSQKTRDEANYFLIKYGPKGDLLWSKTTSQGKFREARATSLTLTAGNRSCISGTVLGSHGDPNILTLAFDQDGKELWTNLFDGKPQNGAKSSGISESAHEELIVFGTVVGDSGSDFVTLKLDDSGKIVWQARYNGEGNGDDVPVAALTESDGSVIVSGYSLGMSGGSDFVTVAYDRNGKQMWEQRYNGAANDVDRPAGLGTDSGGSVYVAGSSWGGKANGFDFVTIKYSKDGKIEWTRRFDGGEGSLPDR